MTLEPQIYASMDNPLATILRSPGLDRSHEESRDWICEAIFTTTTMQDFIPWTPTFEDIFV